MKKMQAISKRPSEDDLSSFAIINSDNLVSFGGKPNAIVRPLRRLAAAAPDPPPPENGETEIAETEIKELEEELISRIHDFHDTEDLTTTVRPDDSKKEPGEARPRHAKNSTFYHKQYDFNRELDAKLRKLQGNSKKSSKNGSSSDVAPKRPLFVTTVPKGIFLQPAKELPLIPRRVYAYASRPRILVNPNVKTNNQINQDNNENNKNTNNILKVTSRSLQSDDKKLHLPQVEPVITPKFAAGLGAIAGGVAGIKLNGNFREPPQYRNVMHDKRIYRGSNFASHGGPCGQGDQKDPNKEAEIKRRQCCIKKFQSRNQRGIIGTPPPVKGRKNETIQTEKYLEELFDRPPAYEISCQTDLFLQRPPSPPYVPAKIGCDVSTQIVDGDLFDFDTEVQPLLEALVGKTLEQAVLEVMHEEELADMKEKQAKLLAIREAERAELRRLEEEEKRLQEERSRRLYQDRIAKKMDREMQERVTAAKLLQGHIADMLPSVLKTIEQLKDADQKLELEKHIGPWLAKEVAEEIGQLIDSKDLLEEIVREVLCERARQYSGNLGDGDGMDARLAYGEVDEEGEEGGEDADEFL